MPVPHRAQRASGRARPQHRGHGAREHSLTQRAQTCTPAPAARGGDGSWTQSSSPQTASQSMLRSGPQRPLPPGPPHAPFLSSNSHKLLSQAGDLAHTLTTLWPGGFPESLIILLAGGDMGRRPKANTLGTARPRLSGGRERTALSLGKAWCREGPRDGAWGPWQPSVWDRAPQRAARRLSTGLHSSLASAASSCPPRQGTYSDMLPRL